MSHQNKLLLIIYLISLFLSIKTINHPENKIIVTQIDGYIANLKFPKYKINVPARIGKNGVTKNHSEGSMSTPLGTFKFGLAFGFKYFPVHKTLKYQIINKDLYWVSDTKSKYYNQLVNIKKVPSGSFDPKKSEHLIEYSTVYEYGIEIVFNPKNDPNLGSAIFLHVMNKHKGYTAGCIAVERDVMKKLLTVIDKDTVIEIRGKS